MAAVCCPLLKKCCLVCGLLLLVLFVRSVRCLWFFAVWCCLSCVVYCCLCVVVVLCGVVCR